MKNKILKAVNEVNQSKGGEGTNKNPENDDWQKQSNDLMSESEKRVDEFKKQSFKIHPKLKSAYNKKVVQLEQQNSDIRKKIKDYDGKASERQLKFRKDVADDINKL